MHKTIRKYTSNTNKSNLNYQWQELNDPGFIDNFIIQRNLAHLNHAQGTSCTIEPLLSLLQDDSFTEFEEAILKGNANLRDKSLNPLQLLFFRKLK